MLPATALDKLTALIRRHAMPVIVPLAMTVSKRMDTPSHKKEGHHYAAGENLPEKKEPHSLNEAYGRETAHGTDDAVPQCLYD